MRLNQKTGQAGISLIESLVAIVVMTLGILGILGVQMRTLADTQTGVRRAQAVRMIEDLTERMKVNPNALGNLGTYVSGWGNIPAGPDCAAIACNSTELAQFDISQWKTAVAANLPLGDANVFVVADETIPNNRRQLGVLISWRENERTNDADYKSVFAPAGPVECQPNRICHLQYIQLTARCTPYTLAGGATPQVYCPVSRTG